MYSALSYRWGDPTELTLTKTTNIEQHKRGILREELPQTIQDGMNISLRLGLRYIWVDCLCIIQDDPSDWEAEAFKMGVYYGQAHLTIAASSSKDACSGFSVPRTKYPDTHTLAMEGDDEGVVYILDAQRSPELDHSRGNIGMLGERAWAFQENVLSKRVAHFTEAGVIWECNESVLFEDGWPLKTFHGVKSHMRTPGSFTDRWGEIVNSYSERKLTFVRDKLPALSGIAAAMHHRSRTAAPEGYRYVAGLWEETLPRDLLWRSNWKRDPSRTPGLVEGPSWTWASVDAKINYFTTPKLYPPDPTMELNDLAVIVRVDCVSQGRNPFAGFAEGCIEIEGPVTRGLVTYNGIQYKEANFEVRFDSIDKNSYLHAFFYPDTALDTTRSHAVDPSCSRGFRRVKALPDPFEAEATFLWICTNCSASYYTWCDTYGLAVVEVESRPGYFTRVGSLTCRSTGLQPSWLLDTLPGSRERICLV